jgi:hypothetical protein
MSYPGYPPYGRESISSSGLKKGQFHRDLETLTGPQNPQPATRVIISSLLRDSILLLLSNHHRAATILQHNLPQTSMALQRLRNLMAPLPRRHLMGSRMDSRQRQYMRRMAHRLLRRTALLRLPTGRRLLPHRPTVNHPRSSTPSSLMAHPH